MPEVLVIGGGAAGLMAAVTAAKKAAKSFCLNATKKSAAK